LFEPQLVVALEEAAFGGDTDCDVDGRGVADVVVDTTLICKFYTVLDLCDELLDSSLGCQSSSILSVFSLRSMALTCP